MTPFAKKQDRRRSWLRVGVRYERIFNWLAAGWSIRRIAVELGPSPRLPDGIDEGFLAAWLFEPEQQARYRQARAQAVEKLVDELVPLADKAAMEPSPECLRAVAIQLDVRRWLAARWTPQWYGDKARAEAPGAKGLSVEHALRQLEELSAAPSSPAKRSSRVAT
jgi:hypothetical protein